MFAACATNVGDRAFRRQFDHFYPKDSRYVTKLYRDAYLKLMANPAGHGDLGLATMGDQAALHRFLLRATTLDPDTHLGGEFSETYGYDLCFLLIRIGDQRFAQALRKLTPRQRESVSDFLDSLISRERDWYPLTVAIYASRE